MKLDHFAHLCFHRPRINSYPMTIIGSFSNGRMNGFPRGAAVRPVTLSHAKTISLPVHMPWKFQVAEQTILRSVAVLAQACAGDIERLAIPAITTTRTGRLKRQCATRLVRKIQNDLGVLHNSGY